MISLSLLSLSLLSLLLAPAALAIPLRRDHDGDDIVFQGRCPVSKSDVDIPPGLDALKGRPHLTMIGVGVQNYTCNDNHTFTNTGAVAQLADISCLKGTAEFDTIQSDTLAAWNNIPDTDPLSGSLAQAMKAQFNLNINGQHYFQISGEGSVPVWDLRADEPFKGNSEAFVVGHKVKSIDSPDDPTNDVTWLELDNDPGQGRLAKKIYRINTDGGQPPSSCTPGDKSVVKYSAKYVFI